MIGNMTVVQGSLFLSLLLHRTLTHKITQHINLPVTTSPEISSSCGLGLKILNLGLLFRLMAVIYYLKTIS